MSSDSWKSVPFGQIADFANGLNFKRGELGETVKILGVSEFQQRTRFDDFSGLDSVPIDARISEEKLLRDGDLLFVRSNAMRLIERLRRWWTRGDLLHLEIDGEAEGPEITIIQHEAPRLRRTYNWMSGLLVKNGTRIFLVVLGSLLAAVFSQLLE